jgi:hypothetical protein
MGRARKPKAGIALNDTAAATAVTSTLHFRAVDGAPWSPLKTLVAVTPMSLVQLPREDWQKQLSIPLSR